MLFGSLVVYDCKPFARSKSRLLLQFSYSFHPRLHITLPHMINSSCSYELPNPVFISRLNCFALDVLVKYSLTILFMGYGINCFNLFLTYKVSSVRPISNNSLPVSELLSCEDSGHFYRSHCAQTAEKPCACVHKCIAYGFASARHNCILVCIHLHVRTVA